MVILSYSFLIPPTEQYYLIHTDSNLDYTRVKLTSHKKAFAFRVQACKQAHILLTSDPSDDASSPNAIELIIGDSNNQKSVFKVNGQIVQTADTPNVLQCTSPRSFWVATEKGEIVFGEGHAYDGRLMTYAWTEDFCCAALSTDTGFLGEWLLYKDSGKRVTAIGSMA